MKRSRLFTVLTFLALSFFLVPPWALGEEESDNKAMKGALVGAGTNVIGGAALDTLNGSSQAQPQYVQVQGPDGKLYWQQVAPPPQDPNKVVLKRAVQGAITGAVAAHVAGEDKGGKQGEGALEDAAGALTKAKASEVDEDHGVGKKKHKHKKPKEGFRPPGWDRGKKVGWGEGDIPPGLRDEKD